MLSLFLVIWFTDDQFAFSSIVTAAGFVPDRVILPFHWDTTGQSSYIVKLGKIFVIASRLLDGCVTCKKKIGSKLFKFSQMFSGSFF